MTKTYRAVISLDRDDELGDRATVTVTGSRWTTDYHWADGLPNLARKATRALFCVDSIESVEADTRTLRPRGAVAVFRVTATV